MNDWSIWIAVGTGGAVGALLRGFTFRAIEVVSPSRAGGGWAKGAWAKGAWAKFGTARSTLVVNFLGSLLLGWIIADSLLPMPEASESLRIFWTTGVCGAFTTFSTLCADAVGFARNGDSIRGGLVVAAHVVLGVAGLLLGLIIAG